MTNETPIVDAEPDIRSKHAEAVRLYSDYNAQKAKKRWEIDPALERDLKPGWMTSYLGEVDRCVWGRWTYWAQLQLECELSAQPIPKVDFCGSADPHGHKMFTRCLNAVADNSLHGDSWMGWSNFTYFDYLLDWLLFGFGHPNHDELPREPTSGASMRLYQLFDLWPLMLWPYDYLGELLAQCAHGRGNGFYPTPHCVVEAMIQMLMCGPAREDGKDPRLETVCDPAVGSGRMLLHASNHSLRLYGQDIDATMCKTVLVNGYLYAPWLVRPIWWLDGTTLFRGNSLSMQPGTPLNEMPQDEEAQAYRSWASEMSQRSDAMTEVAAPHQTEALQDTEFDAVASAKTAPILTRSKKMRDLENAGQIALEL